MNTSTKVTLVTVVELILGRTGRLLALETCGDAQVVP
jgi:hypothetical protein